MPKTTPPTNKTATARVYACLADVEVAAEWLASVRAGECTSAQHEAISHQLLERVIISFALDNRLKSPAITAVFNAAYESAKLPTHRLPKSRRTL